MVTHLQPSEERYEMSTSYLRVSAKEMLHEGLCALTFLCWHNRGSAPLVSQECEGYYYVQADHESVLDMLKAVLTEMVIEHRDVHALPSGKKLQAVVVQDTVKTVTAKEQLLCDPRVRETLIRFIEDAFKPRKNPFTL